MFCLQYYKPSSRHYVHVFNVTDQYSLCLLIKLIERITYARILLIQKILLHTLQFKFLRKEQNNYSAIPINVKYIVTLMIF